MTAANLQNAHSGESMAHMRYQPWGNRAEEERLPQVARLFRAIAFAETVHASNHFHEVGDQAGDALCASMAVFGLATTAQNLQGAFAGETYEINEMYPAYLEIAELQKEKGARLSFHYALAAEKEHAALFKKAKEAVDSGRDVKLGPIHICTVCGRTCEGEAPDKCPICGATKDKLKVLA